MKKLSYILITAGLAGTLLTTPTMVYNMNKARTYQTTSQRQELETVVNITTAQQLEDIITKNEKVVIDIGAIWCGPCREYAPLFEEVAKDYKEQIVFCKVILDKIDYKEDRKISEKYQVMYIPKTVLFKNGKEIHSFFGVRDKDVLKELVDTYLLEKNKK